ncbi:MAG: cysteine desulfurase family protein [bacterium]
MPAYLDYLSWTPIDTRVADAMILHLKEEYGNPLSLHAVGRKTAAAIQDFRTKIANFIGATPQEIVFTSGSMESNSLAVKGVLTAFGKGELLASAVDPLSVILSAEALEPYGYTKSLIPVDANGQIKLLNLPGLINQNTRLASVCWVVPEIGVIQPIEEVAAQMREAGILFHCDATTAARYFPINVRELKVDLLTISSSILEGPPGVGALFVREGVKIQQLIDGGTHERGRRSGEENVPGIAGFAKAVELMAAERQARFNKLKKLDAHLKNRLKEISGLILHADLPSRVPGIISCRIEGVESEALLMLLDDAGIYASSGSHCAAILRKIPHVLTAMGLTGEQAASTLTFSLGWNSEKSEIDEMIEVLKPIAKQLQDMSF